MPEESENPPQEEQPSINPKTMKVLEWLKSAMEALSENPTKENFEAFKEQIMERQEVISDALLDAIKPEFRCLGETISGILVQGIPKIKGKVDEGQ